MTGNDLGATTNDLFAKAMVIGPACPRQGRRSWCHRTSIFPSAFQNLNDLQHAALAYAGVRNVFIHSTVRPAVLPRNPVPL
jgi:hypothetical protein